MVLQQLVVVCLLVCLGAHEPVRGDDGANVQIVVPDSLINTEVQKIIPAIVKKIDAFPIPTCCYDDVGASHVHLNLQSMKASAAKLSMEVSSTTAGMAIHGNAVIMAQGSYRLCLHDDPFSKHACSTLFGCKGNFHMDPNMTFSMTAKLSGENVTVTSPMLKVRSIANNFCSKFGDEINKNIAKIESGGAKALAEVGPKISAMIKEVLKNKTVTVEGFSSKVTLTTGTTSFTGGLAIRGLVQFDDAKTGQVSPWKSRFAIPTASAVEGDSVNVFVAENLLSNALYPLYKAGILHFAMNKTFQLKKYHVELNVTGSGPSVLLNATDQVAVIPLLLKATTGSTTIEGGAVFHAGFNVSVDVINKTSVALHLELSDNIGVANFSSNCSSDCQDLFADLAGEAKLAVPLINAILHNKTPIVELPGGVALSSATLTFGPGYLLMRAAPSLTEFRPSTLLDQLHKLQRPNRQYAMHLRRLRSARQTSRNSLATELVHKLFQPFAIKCPNIPGAKPDGCI